jgi:hypothetical protein
MQQINLGTIINSFTIEGIDTVLILDKDCSSELHSGEDILIKTKTNQEFKAFVNDCLLEDGKNHGLETGTISAIRVAIDGTVSREDLIGGMVFKYNL